MLSRRKLLQGAATASAIFLPPTMSGDEVVMSPLFAALQARSNDWPEAAELRREYVSAEQYGRVLIKASCKNPLAFSSWWFVGEPWCQYEGRLDQELLHDRLGLTGENRTQQLRDMANRGETFPIETRCQVSYYCDRTRRRLARFLTLPDMIYGQSPTASFACVVTR